MQGVLYIKGPSRLLPLCSTISKKLHSRTLSTMDTTQSTGSTPTSCGEYVERFLLKTKDDGPLAGLKFAVKDMYDVSLVSPG